MDQSRFEFIHGAVAGRTRLHCQSLRRNAALAQRLEDVALGYAGVHDAEADPRTGSLLLWHRTGLDLSAVVASLDGVLAGSRTSDTRVERASVHDADAPVGQWRTAWHTLEVA